MGPLGQAARHVTGERRILLGIDCSSAHLALALVDPELGVLAAGGHFLLIKAFDHAPATWLAPVGYFEMVTAVLYGYLAYGDLPDALGWTGILVVVGAGVAISLKERKAMRGLRPGN